ncbi:hypothetical protein MFRU_034g00290 [Monilinia fructicola]|nr:hypothetical protein MFRU_034g00290 [Monilinia fructicola]
MSTLSEAPSDESHLSESTYEFIDTDTESHDENTTESMTSVEYGHPDDMASLADTDNSDESGDEQTHNSSIPGYGLDTSIHNSFNNPTIGPNSAILHDDPDTPLSQSIEFEEPFGGLGSESVSVKHTVAEFTKEQTEAAVRDMNMQNPPSHLTLTIRQTMTKQGLSTKDPLRILYVGSHSAKQDIIHKIASSVAASVEGQERSSRSSSQIYNVVPVSAFGSEKTPEVELMHSSGYQIKVDDCLSAQTLKFEDFPEKPDIIKLNLEDPYSYHSVPEENHSGREGYNFSLQPEWELPHVAIFYCSESDDVQAKRTRTIARKFMSRHEIPSIVISHKQSLNRPQCMSLDQHSIHMCLESRETKNMIHQRLPIDLTSFLNIDARQMNRNLASLTGLYERAIPPTPPTGFQKLDDFSMNPTNHEKPLKIEWTRYLAEWRSFISFGLLGLSILYTIFTGVSNYPFSNQPSISINSKAMSAVPMTTTSVTGSVPFSSISSATQATFTSTRTISPSVNSPQPNSLSKPQLDFEKLTQVAHKKCGTCAAEILGEREVLIRIPSTLKLNWLTKLAMSVNITRENATVDTERAYSSDDGIVLLLPRKEAYGVLNISVVTTKKPRINETFQVDFGTNSLQTMQDLLERFYTFFKEDTVIVDGQTLADIRASAEKVLKDVQQSSQLKLANIDEATRLALERASSITDQLTNSAKSMSLEVAKRSARISHELGSQFAGMEKVVADQLQSLQDIEIPLDEGILKAQIRSKSLWLRMQGKNAEAEEYERRASIAMGKKAEVKRKLKEANAEWTKTPLMKNGYQDKAKREAEKVAKKEARQAARKAAKEAKKEAIAAARRVGWVAN